MTLDEAIRHAEEVAENYEFISKDKETTEITKKGCAECAEEHRQLASWLQDLKEAKKFIRKLQNELLKGTSFYSTSFYEENKELMDKLTEGVEYLDD